MTVEQFQALMTHMNSSMQTMMTAILQQAAARSNGRGDLFDEFDDDRVPENQEDRGHRRESPEGRDLVGRHMKCDNFTGTLESWEEWSHVFRSGVRAQNIKIVEHIKETEKSTIEITELNMNPMQLRYSAQLYDVLGQFCRGEALSIVRSTPDQMGFSAWQRFYKRYNPKNMATAVRMMQEVIAPGRIKELRDIETATNFWEQRVRKLEEQFKEALSPTMQNEPAGSTFDFSAKSQLLMIPF